ncbi:GTP pyrophosphokinase [Oxobacter pfennigii]|uniref:GTP diphosphokinase n=1 Tax=Oxobacter pfennigii TaxID=36849 RepID=A0A0P8W8I3_9CLOT|nr:bifunctional (p)ppGpp synthetase/guanosine-3',5'-bis(diphosphate) 3'-pyrophosphohydrolase [Oxobacter pfennigii]KPU44985.1 GTP pyrophosphokinase [Oxobacter pfennigii]
MLDDLLSKIKTYNSKCDEEIIKKAFAFSEEAHKTQVRESGEPYVTHPIHVAGILVELGLDTCTVAAGLLHDVIEDTKYTYDDIKENFNEEIAYLVDGVTKLGRIEYKTKEEQQADNIRKMLLAMAKDIRVILIKLADRLHNMRTLKYLPQEKQKSKAKETLEIYAPIAHRLGISKIKWELEDLSLRYLHPAEYYELVEKVAHKRTEREEYLEQVITTLRDRLDSAGIKSDIDGRPKHFYSIYKKMVFKNRNFEQIFDLLALRIIVDSVRDCYAALGIVHTLWKPIPGRFKDYIAMPKPNMYQSLHSTVIGPEGQPFEVQIRSWDMHRTAEYGIAAHWKYKEGSDQEDAFDKKLVWLREILEWQDDTRDPKEFMDGLKIELFTDEVFVFTPKGSVIDLPVDSTPIDFAYRIHTDIGNKCIGAKVNGKMVPLDYKLRTGDIVEIQTTSSGRGPSRDWLKIVKSSQAKNKIMQWFKKQNREENASKGKEILEKEIKRQGYNYSDLAKQEWMEIVLKRFNVQQVDDLFSAIGYGGISPNQVITRLKDEYNKTVKQESNDWRALEKAAQEKQAQKKKKESTAGVEVKGADNIMIRFSKCCSPVPGDEIVGYVTKGRGVSIHRKDCQNIIEQLSQNDEKMIEVSWAKVHGTEYQADVQIEANDRQGLLAEITNILTLSKTLVRAINARTSRDGMAFISLTLQINGTEQLEKIMKDFRKISGIKDVYRTRA